MKVVDQFVREVWFGENERPEEEMVWVLEDGTERTLYLGIFEAPNLKVEPSTD